MEEAYRSQSSEQVHGLLATVAELQQRVLSLEKDKKTVSLIIHPSSSSSLGSIFSLHLPTQLNDTTVKLPATSESGAAEGVSDRTTSKPLPGDAEGAAPGGGAGEGGGDGGGASH